MFNRCSRIILEKKAEPTNIAFTDAPSRTYMGKIDTAIISCLWERRKRWRERGKEGGGRERGRKESFDEKIAPQSRCH